MSDVFQPKPLGQVVIDLDGTQLPLAPDTVANHKVDLGTVKGSFARVFGKRFAERFRCAATGFFGKVPIGWVTDIFFRVGITQADADRIVLHPHRVKNHFDQFDTPFQLFIQLLGGNEQVRIVLSKSAYACQSADLTRLFPAINGTELA